MDAKAYYQAGQLDDAIAAAAEEVKRHPADLARRGLLCELLCFAGELERADKHLDAMATQDPEAVMGISLFRQLIRAEQARQDFYQQGRLPEFLGKPSPRLQLHLQASIRLREGQPDEAADLLEQAETQRSPVAGTSAGQPFDDLRDTDDLTASLFEVLTTTGKYYWIPIESVDTAEFHKPERPRDLLWRRVHMIVRGGPDGEVFLPTLYAGAHNESNDQVRLGRLTDWQGGEGSPTRGIGQRTFAMGEEDVAILELQEITITNPVAVSDDGED